MITGKICEFNTGSPGGWRYDHMARVIYQIFCWNRLYETGIEVELEFNNPYLQSCVNLADMLVETGLRNNPQREPFVVVATDKYPKQGTSDENLSIVKYIFSELGIDAVLAEFQDIKKVGSGKIEVFSVVPTVIFLDSNLKEVLAEPKERIEGLIEAIYSGLVVNPRGLEPLGDKNLFHIIHQLRGKISETTLSLIPATGVLTPVTESYVWKNRQCLILKPADGHSGIGFCRARNISRADLKELVGKGNYIFQEEIPESVTEFFHPGITDGKIVIQRSQTDFRMMFGAKGLIGAFSRFGKEPPVNVGSGGGGHGIVAVTSAHTPVAATAIIIDTISKIPADIVVEMINKMVRHGERIGFIYKDRGIPVSLVPRIVSLAQIAEMKKMCFNLWADLLVLEKMWLAGDFDEYIVLPPEQEAIIKATPWEGSAAIVAADCLFNFHF